MYTARCTVHVHTCTLRNGFCLTLYPALATLRAPLENGELQKDTFLSTGVGGGREASSCGGGQPPKEKARGVGPLVENQPEFKITDQKNNGRGGGGGRRRLSALALSPQDSPSAAGRERRRLTRRRSRGDGAGGGKRGEEPRAGRRRDVSPPPPL